MRSTRLLAAGLATLAVAACASSTPGWTYAPAPSATAVPSADASGSLAPSASASAAPSASTAPSPSATPSAATSTPSGSAAPSGAGIVLQLSAQNIAFDPTELSAPADQAFQIEFANNDPSIPHNVAIKDAAGAEVFNGEIFNGVETRTYDAPPLAAGAYQFACLVHPNMTGTLTVQ
jgi:plastocyanin